MVGKAKNTHKKMRHVVFFSNFAVMKKILYTIVTLALFCACKNTQLFNINNRPQQQKSIVVLYENDVHCGIDGYSKIAGLRDAIVNSDTAYAAVVSCGDYLQGGSSGAISQGQYIIDIMRNVGYTAVTLGNHEFDYGTPRMKELQQKLQAPVVCANFFDMGAEQPYYAPFIIRRYGKKRVAFVGACTPETMRAESYSFYDEAGNQLYDLREKTFFKVIQKAVDDARLRGGADYVVLLSHVGEASDAMNIDSHKLVAATRGIDVVLDGHSHSTIPYDEVANLDGKIIKISQTGTQFNNIGKLLITNDGTFSTTLLPTADIPFTNDRVTNTTDSVKALLEQVTTRQLSSCNYALEIIDKNGVRQVRRAETNMADLVTDAFRHNASADIGLYNGGGIRNSISAGNITYGDVTNVLPFDNRLVVLEVQGSLLITMLERCTAAVPEEDGNFPQVSGLRYTIHSVSHTVSDIQVLDAATGKYVAIDPNKKYSVSTTDYYSSGGFDGILKDCTVLKNTTLLSRDVLSDYLEHTIGSTIGDAYKQSQGRITIIED